MMVTPKVAFAPLECFLLTLNFISFVKCNQNTSALRNFANSKIAGANNTIKNRILTNSKNAGTALHMNISTAYYDWSIIAIAGKSARKLS